MESYATAFAVVLKQKHIKKTLKSKIIRFTVQIYAFFLYFCAK